MREIKFRVWDLLMEDWSDENIEFDIDCGFINTFSKIGNKTQDRYVLQQFTGLKDKDGKEIYEGDIVECFIRYRGEPDGVGFKAHVRYNEDFGVWQIAYKNIEDKEVWDNIGRTYFLEVIGNIYDNPELLESKTEDSEPSLCELCGKDSCFCYRSNQPNRG